MIRLIELHGANKRDDGTYTDRGPIWINVDKIAAIYDHTILIAGNQIRVMETAEEVLSAKCVRSI